MAGARRDPADLSGGAACAADVILTTPAALATYHGDPWVILNPAGTVGVKVTGTAQYQTACMQQAAGVLKSLH